MLNTEDKKLILSTRKYAKEVRLLSWWHTVSLFALLVTTISASYVITEWPVRLTTSIISGLLILRGFSLYHDFLHGAVLRNSKLANFLFTSFGIFTLSPKPVWNESHNYHHAHNAIMATSHIGSYKMVSTHIWKRMSNWQKFGYRIIRHPLNFVFAFFTVFAYGMCITSFLRDMKKHWTSLFAVVIHIVTASAISWHTNFSDYFFTLLLPFMIAATTGAYLFYAQHNFPDVDIKPLNQWSFVYAALQSSSFMKMGSVMNWITGNIGYHHIHHLNSKIPFYRLPEAMKNIPELQYPLTTSLKPSDIYKCFQLKLWDPDKNKMVGYIS